MKTKLYHFYLDEGGMFGSANYAILKRKRNPGIYANDGDILHYYFGKLSVGAIARHLQLFRKAFPSCAIFTSLTDIKMSTKELLTEHGM